MAVADPMKRIHASSIGNFARMHIDGEGRGRVMGCTSKGVFCLTASSRIVFLTSENLHGPLNVVVDSLPEFSPDKWTGAETIQTVKALRFPGMKFQVALDKAHTWQPPDPPLIHASPDQRRALLNTLAIELLASGRESIFSPVLKWVLNPNLRIITPHVSYFEFFNMRRELHRAIQINDPRQAAISLNPFLGMGPGLTPAGDDFVWGFLFTLTRWQSLLCPRFDLDKFSSLLLASARRNTTFLSATLMECASFGWADETFISTLDELFSGDLNISPSAKKIIVYGNSSGIDSFAGMTLAATIN